MSYLSFRNIFYFHCAYKTVCLLLYVYELHWARKNGREIATLGQACSNFFIFLFGTTVGGPLAIYVYSFSWKFFAAHRIFESGLSYSLTSFFICAFLAEFISYVVHRAAHTIPFLWALHSTHHSDPHMNISTSARHNFSGLTYAFFSPLALLGAPWEVLSAAITLVAIYPFWLHSQSIPKLPYVEWLFYTPSGHRVHHGLNKQYINKNFGGMLTIFDHLFGTYEPEVEKPIYYQESLSTHNLFKMNLTGLYQYFTGTAPDMRSDSYEKKKAKDSDAA